MHDHLPSRPHSYMRPPEPDGLVLRIGLDGSQSVELHANESDSEARLRELWNALRPIIEEFFVGMRS